MSLADDVDLEELVMTKDDLSGADIKAVCSEWNDFDIVDQLSLERSGSGPACSARASNESD